MDFKTTANWIDPDDEFTDDMGHRHKAVRTRRADGPVNGVYVYVEGQDYPEFYVWNHSVTIHIPDAKFQPGDFVIARNGQGSSYQINRVAKDRFGKLYYIFDNGSVHVAKRARSGRHYADRADLGYKKLSDD